MADYLGCKAVILSSAQAYNENATTVKNNTNTLQALLAAAERYANMKAYETAARSAGPGKLREVDIRWDDEVLESSVDATAGIDCNEAGIKPQKSFKSGRL